MKNDLVLPAPQTDSPFTLMQALETRRTTRKWSGEPVSEQDLSNLLWAACGITKEKKRKHQIEADGAFGVQRPGNTGACPARKRSIPL